MSAWTDAGDGVLVRQSRAYRMNSTVLLRDAHAVVIDPGVLPSEMADIAGRVAQHAPRFENVALVFTHPHWDHVLGRPWFPAATTYAHVGFHDELESDAAKIEARARAWIEGEGEAWPRPFETFVPDLTVRATTRLAMGPFEAIAHHVPGHCASQIALHLPALGVFVAADMLSDIEIPWLEGPAWVYRGTLKALMHVFEHEDIRTLIPGHGSIAHGRHAAYQRVLDDFAYLHQLQELVDGAVREGLPLERAYEHVNWQDPTGRMGLPGMQKVHRENVRLTYEALADRAEERRS